MSEKPSLQNRSGLTTNAPSLFTDACPRCDTTQIYERQDNWTCRVCEHEFTRPHRRLKKTRGRPRSEEAS